MSSKFDDEYEIVLKGGIASALAKSMQVFKKVYGYKPELDKYDIYINGPKANTTTYTISYLPKFIIEGEEEPQGTNWLSIETEDVPGHAFYFRRSDLSLLKHHGMR